jgi:hypothetical protein
MWPLLSLLAWLGITVGRYPFFFWHDNPVPTQSNPDKPERRPIGADSAIMNPAAKVIALKCT